MIKLSKIILLIVFLLLWLLSIMSACGIISLIYYICDSSSGISLPDPEVAIEINERLESGYTSWHGVMSYLYYDTANIGSTTEEIHDALSKIGPWEIVYSGEPKKFLVDFRPVIGEHEEIIRFTEENTNKAMQQWIFFYDIDGKLIEKRVRKGNP